MMSTRSLILTLPSIFSRHKSSMSRIDKSSVPRLDPADLQEKVTLGSGPGGQAVNKTANAIFLKHLPTGLWVKCHQTRSVEMNRKIAKQLLITKLDNYVNEDNSVENQQKAIDKLKLERKKEKTRKKYADRKDSSLMENSEKKGGDEEAE